MYLNSVKSRTDMEILQTQFHNSEVLVLRLSSKNLKAQNLLGCTAVFLTECRPTFKRYVLPPSLER
jgi:hypothetical protein